MASPDLPALLARVEAATGPDRELDSRLWAALGDRVGGASDLDAWLRGDPIPPAEPVMGLMIAEALDRGVYGIAEAWRVPRFTTSLDATVALVERLRPRWLTLSGYNWDHFYSTDTARRAYFCSMRPHMVKGYLNIDDASNIVGHGRTEVLARLAALLRSMIEEEGK